MNAIMEPIKQTNLEQTEETGIWPPAPQVTAVVSQPPVSLSVRVLFSRTGGFIGSFLVLAIGFVLSPTNREPMQGGWHTAASDPLRYQLGLSIIIGAAASSIIWSVWDIVRTWSLLQSKGKGQDAMKFILGFPAILISVMAVDYYHVAWTLVVS